MIRRITRPLENLNIKLFEISRGEADLSSTLNITSNEEIGRIATNFNLFVANYCSTPLEGVSGYDPGTGVKVEISCSNHQMSNKVFMSRFGDGKFSVFQ